MGLKPGYKQTEVGVIPAEWEVRSIADFAKVKGGKRLPLGRGLVETPTPHPYIRVTDMRFGGVDLSDIKYVPEDVFPAICNYRIRDRDIFISVAGTLGIVGKIPSVLDGANLTENADRITAILCDRDYLLYNLMSERIQNIIESEKTVGAQPKLALNRIQSFRIALPPTKDEQRAIAKALSDVDALISALDRLIAKKRDLRQAVMQQLLTGQTRLPGFSGDWEVLSMAEKSTLKARIGWQGLTTAEYLPTGEYYLVTGTDFVNGRVNWASCCFVDASRYVQDKNIQLKTRDILLTKDGTIGKVGFVDSLPGPATLNSGVFVIRPKGDSYAPLFFYYILTSRVFEDFLAQLQAGSTISHLYQKDFVNFSFRAPSSVAEQTAIATVLSDMDAEIPALEARLAKTRALKQGMMQELLTGRIRLVAGATSQTATQQRRTAQSEKTRHNWAFNEAVVIAALASKFGSQDYPLGRMRCTKLTYLMHRHVEGNAEGYLKKAAGPYNPATRYKGPEDIAQKNGYVQVVRSGKRSGFVPGENIHRALAYFRKWYGPQVLGWMEQFRFKTNDGLELLTTVDMAIQDLRSAQEKASPKRVRTVIRSHPEWKAKLTRPIFSDANITAAIESCREIFD